MYYSTNLYKNQIDAVHKKWYFFLANNNFALFYGYNIEDLESRCIC